MKKETISNDTIILIESKILLKEIREKIDNSEQTIHRRLEFIEDCLDFLAFFPAICLVVIFIMAVGYI